MFNTNNTKNTYICFHLKTTLFTVSPVYTKKNSIEMMLTVYKLTVYFMMTITFVLNMVSSLYYLKCLFLSLHLWFEIFLFISYIIYYNLLFTYLLVGILPVSFVIIFLTAWHIKGTKYSLN